jgi:hypothetical protein
MMVALWYGGAEQRQKTDRHEDRLLKARSAEMGIMAGRFFFFGHVATSQPRIWPFHVNANNPGPRPLRLRAFAWCTSPQQAGAQP